MKKIATILLILFICFQSYSQRKNDLGYTFGKVTTAELEMNTYPKDTTANAVVLFEQGDTKFIEKGNRIVLHTTIYKKIKILNSNGFNKATIKLLLYYDDGLIERASKIKAITHNENEQTELKKEQVFKTELSDNYNEVSFTLPNVHEGSVIEYSYVIVSPFVFKFKGWDFQDDIPKIKSNFKAKIPGKFLYNRKLVGLLKLSENSATIQKRCFSVKGNPNLYECEVLSYAMKDIPAFIEEDYMTSQKNFKSRIAFELSEYIHYDGYKQKFTSTWKSADQDFKKNDNIGGQLGKKLYFDKLFPPEILNETNYLERAKKVYYFIQNHYTWNGAYWTPNANIKKAYKESTGTVGEINITLVNALNASGIKSDLVMLSTRNHGIPTKIHPVITEFNYSIAKISVGNKSYFLDATDKSMPFGVLPFRCLNGDARVLDFKRGSYWETIEPIQNSREKITMMLKLNEKGTIEGKMRISYFGYEAINKRKKIKNFNEEKYIANFEDTNENLEITHYKRIDIDKIEVPLKEEFEIIMENDGIIGDKIYLYPFFMDRLEENPFKLDSRIYPVDFGYPTKSEYTMTFLIPENFEIASMPKNKSMALPNKKGYFMYNSVFKNHKININFKFILNKPYFYNNEYRYLKELFKQMILTQNEPIVLKRLN